MSGAARSYRFKFYLNASHSAFFNGKQGAVHPHTWEYSLLIRIHSEVTVQFDVYEHAVTEFFDYYQNKTMNDIPPFDTIIPTLENMTDYFGEELRRIIAKLGGKLLELEGSETPTRSYIVDYSQSGEIAHIDVEYRDTTVSDIFDDLLDSL